MFKDLKIDNKKMCNFCNFFEFYVKVIPCGYPSSRADFQSVCCEAKGYKDILPFGQDTEKMSAPARCVNFVKF